MKPRELMWPPLKVSKWAHVSGEICLQVLNSTELLGDCLLITQILFDSLINKWQFLKVMSIIFLVKIWKGLKMITPQSEYVTIQLSLYICIYTHTHTPLYIYILTSIQINIIFILIFYVMFYVIILHMLHIHFSFIHFF